MIYDSLNPYLKTINLYQCESSFCTNERFTPNHYMLYVHKGTGQFVIDSVIYDAQAGDLFFCPQGYGNNIIASKEDPFLLSGIDFFFWKEEQSKDCEPNNSAKEITRFFEPKINIASNHFSFFLIQEMISNFTRQTVFSQSYCNSLLQSFLLNIIEYGQTQHRRANEDCNAILEFINKHSDVSMAINNIAQQFNYHPSTLNRMVKRVTGMTIKEYQIDIRIKKAMNLLLYSNKSIADVALCCGYQSIFFFSRQFKEKANCLPTKFRELQK